LLVVLGLASCGGGPDVGEVAIKVEPGFTVPQLAIGTESGVFTPSNTEKFIAKVDGNPTVLFRAPGRIKLQYIEPDGQLVTACNFEVKKNRVVTITLRMIGREVKCEKIV
jgi:hypothetical protein